MAAERGQEPFDALLDVVVADGLRTGLRPPIPVTDDDWKARGRAWADPRAIVGGSDAGAHLDTMCGAVYSTALLGEGVRERGAAVVGGGRAPAHRRPRPPLRSARTAAVWRPGTGPTWWYSTPSASGTARNGPVTICPAAPAASTRRRRACRAVLVNGTEIVRDGSFTEAVPGQVLRSGRDTETVRADWGVAAVTAADGSTPAPA